jgi:hypothetical protein
MGGPLRRPAHPRPTLYPPPMDMTTLIALGAGVLALFAGRRLLWLVVAAAGFLLGYLLPELIPATADWSDAVRIGIGVVLALLLALAARTLTQLGAAILGFLLASTFALPIVNGLELVGDASDTTQLVVAVGVGLIGAIVAALLLDPAFVVLTALWGGTQVMRTASAEWEVPPGWYGLILAGLVAAGVVVQFKSR